MIIKIVGAGENHFSNLYSKDKNEYIIGVDGGLKVLNDLKIDKSFIDNISESYRDKVIVETIIEFAKKMDFYVVAEGIETKDQLDLTRSMGCDAAQGFYYSKPLPPCEVESMYHI